MGKVQFTKEKGEIVKDDYIILIILISLMIITTTLFAYIFQTQPFDMGWRGDS